MTPSQNLSDALAIPVPTDPSLVLDGCRRLLGPSLYSASPGAVGDCLVTGHDAARVLDIWLLQIRDLLGALGWETSGIVTRPFDGGASLYIPAAVDQLFTAAYIIEAAWYFTATQMIGQTSMAFAEMVSELGRISALEANPDLLALTQAAADRGIDRLLDDDSVTIGHGAGSMTFATQAIPAKPDWAKRHNIPVALVTGTNGKTTTTRLIAAMGAADGLVSGLSSTDMVQVGSTVLDRGDYAGPAGARLLLRDPRLQVGVLEVARGGILRRGLPIRMVRAAVVTNIAADHLGHYGIHTLAELAQVKLSVQRALVPEGWLILNADDAVLVAGAKSASGVKVWFSLDAQNRLIVSARAKGAPCGWVENGMIMLSDGRAETALVAIADVPLTLGGAARYNIENALAAALAGRALGVSDQAIGTVLRRFSSNSRDNPGRANEFPVRGARVFVDFAHNPHSIAAITSALVTLPANRRFALLSHAGDRSDAEIRALTQGVFDVRPDVVVVAENANYLRGRKFGEVPALIRQACLDCGLDPANVLSAENPAKGARKIIELLSPGDLALLLVHDQRAEIFAMLAAEGSSAEIDGSN